MITFKQFLMEMSLSKPKFLDDFIRSTKNIPSNIGLSVGLRSAVGDIAEPYKFKQIGSGLFAVVLKNKTYPYVLKIYDKNDTGYKHYLDFCIKNQDNPYVPKIKGRPVSIRDTRYMVIRIETLEPINKGDMRTFYILWEGVRNGTTTDRNLKKVIDFIEMMKTDPGIHFDLHQGNVMKRGNQLVVTDPLAG